MFIGDKISFVHTNVCVTLEDIIECNTWDSTWVLL